MTVTLGVTGELRLPSSWAPMARQAA